MENKEIVLTLDINKINVLLNGLGELPSKLSFELIQEIHNQVSKQLKIEDKEA